MPRCHPALHHHCHCQTMDPSPVAARPVVHQRVVAWALDQRPSQRQRQRQRRWRQWRAMQAARCVRHFLEVSPWSQHSLVAAVLTGTAEASLAAEQQGLHRAAHPCRVAAGLLMLGCDRLPCWLMMPLLLQLHLQLVLVLMLLHQWRCLAHPMCAHQWQPHRPLVAASGRKSYDAPCGQADDGQQLLCKKLLSTWQSCHTAHHSKSTGKVSYRLPLSHSPTQATGTPAHAKVTTTVLLCYCGKFGCIGQGVC